MRLLRLIGFTVASALLAARGMAQQPDSTPVKIGFVDVERALASTDEGKAKLKELDDWARPRQDEINQLGKELNDMQGELMSKQGTAASDVLEELNRKFIAKKRDLEDRQRIAKRDFEERQSNILRDLGSKLQDVIAKYSDENRYTAVFILKQNDLAYLATSADLTEIVVKLYNAKYPRPAKAADPTPTKK